MHLVRMGQMLCVIFRFIRVPVVHATIRGVAVRFYPVYFSISHSVGPVGHRPLVRFCSPPMGDPVLQLCTLENRSSMAPHPQLSLSMQRLRTHTHTRTPSHSHSHRIRGLCTLLLYIFIEKFIFKLTAIASQVFHSDIHIGHLCIMRTIQCFGYPASRNFETSIRVIN